MEANVNNKVPVIQRCHPVVWLLLVLVSSAGAADRFLVGACTHFSQGKGVVELNLASIKRAGTGSIRDEASWGAIERIKGELAMSQRFETYVRKVAAEGVNVLLILDYANRFYDDGDRPRSPGAIEGFCRYSEFAVRHFGEDVSLYEVWNEWDIGIGLPEPYRKGGSPADYVKLLKAVYPRIKAANPDAYSAPWGFRDWVGRGELVANRISVVAGHRPCILGNDLSDVSVAEVIPRPREIVEKE